MEETLNARAKVIASLGAELNRAHKMEEEAESRLERFKEEAREQKEKARERNTEVGKLKRRVKRFYANRCHAMGRETYSCVFRFDGRLSHAVEKAVKTEDASSNVLEVKNKHGVINDWARETMVQLTGVENIPANSSFRIFETCATRAGKEVRGSWDRRSVPRVMLEVMEAAEMSIVERFLECIGLSLARR